MIDDGRDEKGAGWSAKLMAAVAILGVGGLGAYHWAVSRAWANEACSSGDARAVELIAVDTTDRLAAANPARVDVVVDRILREAPGAGIVGIAALDGDASTEPEPAFLKCAPRRPEESNVVLDAINPIKRERAAYEAEARAAVRELVKAATATRSPLAEQIVNLVTDARISAANTPNRRLTVVSDLLQASREATAYGDRLDLPDKPPRVLESWRVRFVQTTNPRDAALQNEEVRAEWRRWALAAGATSVTFEGLGLAAEAP